MVYFLCFPSSNNSYSIVITASVLPTYVEPRNINDLIGLLKPLISARSLFNYFFHLIVLVVLKCQLDFFQLFLFFENV